MKEAETPPKESLFIYWSVHWTNEYYTRHHQYFYMMFSMQKDTYKELEQPVGKYSKSYKIQTISAKIFGTGQKCHEIFFGGGLEMKLA